MLSRRRFALGVGLAALGIVGRDAPLSGWLPTRLDGTFFQPWRGDFDDWAVWRTRFELMRRLGCEQLVLQWVEYADGNDRFAASASALDRLFDLAGAHGLTLRIGLPFDNGFWATAAAGERQIGAHLETVLSRQKRHLETASYAGHSAFAGWYLPQELDDYTWRQPAVRDRLLNYLSEIAAAAAGRGDRLLAVSTFHSVMATEGAWPDLWSAILERVALVPLIQDGAGVTDRAPASPSAGPARLAESLRAQAKPFELVVELFKQFDDGDGRSALPFTARAASFPRVQTQLERAAGYGAGRILGFAVDPYMTDRTEGGAALRRAYLLAAADPRSERIKRTA